jgi:hypothetical protein
MTTNIFSEEFIVNEESGGATIQLNSINNSTQFFPSGQSHLDVEFVIPQITLQPGDIFGWDFLLTLNVRSEVGSFAEADFLNTASISVALPAGFEDALSLDGVNPASVAWITTDAPPPDPVLSQNELMVILMLLLGNSNDEEETVPE